MITFNSARVKRVVYFKDSQASLNSNPLTFIRGVNLDADPADPTGNGAGKSLFFGSIPTVMYASPPTATKKKAKKEILSKGSEIIIDCVGADGHHYVVTQTPSKYTIFKNGEDMQIRTVPLAEEYIRTHIFPLSEVEYYTHGFISTLRPYLMRSDSDSNRLEHFSQIFQLNNYEELRGYFSKKLRTIKDNEIRMSVLEAKALTLKEKLAKIKKLVSKNDLAEAKTEHKKLDSKIQANVQIEFGLNKMVQTYKTLLTIEEELDELRGKYKYKDHPSARLAILKEQKSLVKKWEEYNSLLKAYNKSVKSTQEKLNELKLPKELRANLEANIQGAKSKLEELESQIEKQEEAKDEYDRLLKKAKPIAAELEEEHGIKKGDKVDLKADYQPEIDSLRAQLRLKKLLNHDHLDGNSCPTCMSEVDLDNIKTLVKKAEKELPKLEKKQEAQSLYKQIVELRNKISAIEFDQKKFDKLKAQESEINETVDKLKEQIKVWKRHDELQSILKDIEKPKQPKEKADTDLTYDQLDEHMDLCTEILRHVQSKKKMMENNSSISEYKTVKSVKSKIKEVQSDLEKLEEKLSIDRKRLGEISDVIEKQASYKSELDLYSNELSEVQEEIDKIKPSLDDKKVLEVLIKAYSSKGLKTIVANQICTLLETNLNYYRNLIFSEPFTFTVRASETGLAIRVDRGNDMVSDVRNLSGAESNCFNLLFLIALLPLIPENRRLNMVVLDEPSAHMDAVSRRIFTERYLPALMEVVPNIYVITPNDEYLNGSSEWIVKKEKGVANLITTPHRDLATVQQMAMDAIEKAKSSSSTKETKVKKKRSKKTAA